MLDSTTASELMVTRLITLSPELHVFDGVGKLLKHKITGAPVIDNRRKFLGVFSEKCCMNVLGVMANDATHQPNAIKAEEFMVSDVIALTPESDVFEAISTLLKNRISGAPVLDADGQFVGVFSEKNSMQVLISAAYEQLPTTRVEAFMNRDRDRLISPETELADVAEKFRSTHYRRLAVMDGDRLLGQISRRDVLRVEQRLSKPVRHRIKLLADQILDHRDLESDEAPKTSIAYFMDRHPMTITPETDFLTAARIFLDSPYRRLPVLEEDRLVGQISRRDILVAANKLLDFPEPQVKNLLYLSSLVDRQDAPI